MSAEQLEIFGPRGTTGMTFRQARLTPKSIALVRGAPLGDGNVRRVVASWARILGKYGHRVSVVAEGSVGDTPWPDMAGVVERRYAPPRFKPSGLKPLLSQRGLLAELMRLRDARGLDLLVCHDALSVPALRARFPRVPVIATFHSPLVSANTSSDSVTVSSLARTLSYPVTRALVGRIEHQALSSCHHTHTLSDCTWELLRSRHGNLMAPGAWTKIPGTYDEERFVLGDRAAARSTLGLPQDELILLSVQRLDSSSGAPRILTAAKAVRDAGLSATFVIAGEGALRRHFEQQARNAGVADRMRFLGLVPEDLLPSYYQAANAFLLPGENLECFGLSTIQAMATGTVPLVTPCGGPEEICKRFPDLVSVQNTEQDFVNLVLRFVRGEVGYEPALLNRVARERYSEQAITPAVESLAARFLGVPQLVMNRQSDPPANTNTSISA